MNDDHNTSANKDSHGHQQHSPIHQWQHDTGAAHVSNHGKKRKWWPPRMPRTKKQWIITAIVAVLVLGGGGLAAYQIWFKPKPKTVTKQITKKPVATKPTPQVITSNLTGLPISNSSVNDQPVTAVMIENSQSARPQSGLDQAGVVFEAVAEGGITRFVTLFQDSAPDYIGPVRSVRPYYIQWLMGFDAAVAHVGGSPEALQDIKTWGVKDLDQFYNGSYYHRISTRAAPHNVYTSIANLNALEAKKGFGKPTYTGFARKAAAPSAAPNATSIDFSISSALYNVHYDYDGATNSYKRFEGGAAHMAVNGSGVQTQITPKVVVGLVMPKGIEADDLHTSYNTLGSGQAFIFQDGLVMVGTWHKPNNATNFTFTDQNGAAIKLNPGQTWLTALGSASSASYK
jgi:hypothetical protein